LAVPNNRSVAPRSYAAGPQGCYALSARASIPNAIGDAVECEAHARGAIPPDPLPLEYGKAFGLTVRFGTGATEAPVLRMMWRNENGAWRIRSYDVELP
jgi:hypothetical protein